MKMKNDYVKIEQTSYHVDYFTRHPESVDKLKNKDHIPILKKMLGITSGEKQAIATPSTPENETIEIKETPEKIKETPNPKKNNNKKKQ